MHGTALAFGITVHATGQLGHDAPRLHAAGQHMRMITIAGDDLVACLRHRLQADHNRFLSNIEMAKTANLSHCIDLAAALFKTANARHITPHGNQLVIG